MTLVSLRGRLRNGPAILFEEPLMSIVFTREGLINLLEKKGIITKGELLEEIKRLRDKKKGTKVR